MRTALSLLLLVLAGLLLLLLGIAFMVAWSVGLGWLLLRILPFDLFQASLLAMIASIIVGYIGARILAFRVPTTGSLDDEELHDVEIPIAATRFYNNEADKTEEAWFRYEIANDIYWELEESPQIVRRLDTRQLEELAIRLTDVVVAALKRKGRVSKRVGVTLGALHQEMDKMAQKPYDEDILQAAVAAVNQRLVYDEELADIVRRKRWRDKTIEL